MESIIIAARAGARCHSKLTRVKPSNREVSDCFENKLQEDMSETKEKEEEKPVVAKTAVDLQRLKLQKLMKNPEKPVILPERPKAKNTPTVPEFVRNVMGSSAGAGSGEFHVYRHLRRKEYARQKFIQEKGKKELLDAEYHKKLEENRRLAEEITAKKRAKRLKKKQKRKQRKKMKVSSENKSNEDQFSNTEDEDSDSDQSETNTEMCKGANETSSTSENEQSKEADGTTEILQSTDTAEKTCNEAENTETEPVEESNKTENEK